MRSSYSTRLAAVLTLSAYFLLFLALAVCLQYESGVYSSELAHYPDEPGHLVSALMIHDYVVAGFPHPLHYAENYYLHYPKVAIGWWPPVFHILGGFWMLIFSTSHRSLLMFMAVQCAAVAVLIAYFAKSRAGKVMGFIGGCLFVTFYIVQYDTSMFMLDMLVTLWDLIATVLLIRFFRTERTRDAVWFGLASSAALLTKANSMALVAVPVLMIIFLRRWSILKKPGLYVSAGLIALLGLPWQIVSLRMLRASSQVAPLTPSHVKHLALGYVPLFVESAGYLVPLIAAAGVALLLIRGQKIQIELVACGALCIAVYGLHICTPLPEPDTRFMTPVFAGIAVFFVIGITEIAELAFAHPAFVHRKWRAAVAPSLAVVVLTVHWATVFHLPPRGPLGYIPTADALDWPEMQDGVALICADGYGEGALVAEVALRDRRPNRFVLRGSKVIIEGRWQIRIHDPLLKTANELEEYLLSVPVDAVVVDLTAPLWQRDTDLVLSAMRENPQKWQLYREITATGSQHHIQVFRYIGPRDPNARRSIQLHMRHTLGRDLKL